MGWFDDARCPPSQASGVSRAHRPSVPRCLHSVPLTTLNGTPVGSSELVSWCAGAPICLTCRASRLAPPRSSGDVAAADFEIPVQRCVAAGAGPGPPATAGCHVRAPCEDGRTAPTSRAAECSPHDRRCHVHATLHRPSVIRPFQREDIDAFVAYRSDPPLAPDLWDRQLTSILTSREPHPGARCCRPR